MTMPEPDTSIEQVNNILQKPETEKMKHPKLSQGRSCTDQSSWSNLHQLSQLHTIAELLSLEGRQFCKGEGWN